MNRTVGLILMSAMALSLTGCFAIQSQTSFTEVQNSYGLRNITTGDGTFENYTATGHYKATEIGVALGFGFLKLMELVPFQRNEDLLAHVALDARNAGADALINVKPQKSWFIGIPFVFIGLYIDTTEATGIKLHD